MIDKVFDLAFDLLMVNEGGYVNDPHDPGGETKYGISKRAYPEEDIKALTKNRAKFLFKRDYWDVCKCDLLPPALAIVVSDTAYNSGNIRAIKILQQTLMTTQDGIIGNQTLSIANRCNVKDAVENYSTNRLLFLQKLSGWKRYGKGWTARANKVEDLAKTLI